tara:strand:+ start:2288 stop:2416 length:129 start_codon:yes stop_codon:yes gene_type:complete
MKNKEAVNSSERDFEEEKSFEEKELELAQELDTEISGLSFLL